MASTSTGTVCEKWYFTKEQLENTPSRKCGFDALKELSYRQQAANFIQDMGQKLKVLGLHSPRQLASSYTRKFSVTWRHRKEPQTCYKAWQRSQLCINTAIVYMHRFYVFHSFTHFPWHQMAAAALFLAAKVEEQPRKLEYVIKISNICRNGRDINLDVSSERYIQQSQDLVFNENVLLQTLGFDVAIDHPHTHVVRCCHLVRASKDLAQTSYFMASNSLHLTTMCLQYKPTVVACFCILVACKWSNWEIPLSNEKKEWYSYVDPTVTAELLQQLTEEFLVIFEASPSRLKIASNTESMMIHGSYHHTNSPFDTDPKKITGKEDKSHIHRTGHEGKSSSENDLHKHRPQRPHEPGASTTLQQRERDRNRERLAAQQQKALLGQSKVPMGGHHRPPSSSSSSTSGSSVDQRMKHPHPRPPQGYAPSGREPRDILRETKESPFGLPGAHGKDASKREYNATGKVEGSSYGAPPPGYGGVEKRGGERAKAPPIPKPYAKPETDTAKKHPNLTTHEKSNAYLNKPLTNAAAPKIEKPCVDPIKANHSEPTFPAVKAEPPNGTTDNSYPQSNLLEIKHEPIDTDSPIAMIKRPSLFSPEQTPPHKKTTVKTEPEIKSEPITPSLSPLSSPVTAKRNRNYSSSSSEPELRPVMKKIDQVEGFENLIRDNTIGINKHNQVGDNMETRAEDVPDKVPVMVNGLETNPIVISNLLKETVTTPQLTENVAQHPEKEHHHHKSKKKNKEKHKHKDKEKSREDKEKKRKHKDKDREKHHRERVVETDGAMQAEPIKLKIQKDRIQPVVMTEPASSSSSHSLKIKIPKDKIKTESITELTQPQPPTNQPIRLKIPKEKLSNCVGLDGGAPTVAKRRERSSPGDAPPSKLARTSHHKETAGATSATSKQNGRHSYGKVAQTGEGESSLHRLAESKYTHKNSTS